MQTEEDVTRLFGGDNYEHFPQELLNELNKQLQTRLKEQEAKRREIEQSVEDLHDRIKVISDHHSSVQNEIQQTQKLIEVQNKQIESEDHIRQMNEREIGRLNSELRRHEKDLGEFQEKLDNVQNELFRANEKLDKFKIQMNFNQEELEQWQLAEKQKEEDFLAVEKYKKKDNQKIKELGLQIEKLQRELENKKHQLEVEITETQAAQIQLDKTAEDFKKLNEERQGLVTQWEEAMHKMNKRDELIKSAGDRFAQNKKKIREKQERLFQESQHLNIHSQNNRAMDQKIAVISREVEKQRKNHDQLKTSIAEIEDEIGVITNTLAKASTELNNKRIENKCLEEDLENKNKKVKMMEKQKVDLETELQQGHAKLDQLENKAQYAENLLKETETKQRDYDRQLEELKEEKYRQSQTLFKAKKEQQNYIASISGANAQSKNLQAKIQQMDNDGYKQQELLYNIEFKVQQMERKVSRAQGERTEEEKQILNQKINELQQELDQLEDTHKMLSNEWKKVLGEVRMMKKKVTDMQKDKERMEERATELKLENQSHEIEYKDLYRRKEDSLVQHDVLKLQVKRLKELLRDRADEVSGLENRKSQLEITILEREAQITAHKEILLAEIKSVEEERRRVALELTERKQHIDRLKNRFEILIQRLQPLDNEYDGTQEISQAQFLIKAIQEREELQRKGDMLDAQILELEKQDKSLNKTLDLFKARNILHMGTYKTVNLGDENVQKKMQLEQKIKETDSLMSRRIQEKTEYAESAAQKAQELDVVLNAKKELEARAKAIEESKNLLEQELEAQRKKFETHYKILRSAIKEAKKVKQKESPEMRDVEVSDHRTKNRQALQTLTMLAQSDPEMFAALQRLLAEKGIPALQPSSQPQSTRSSVMDTARGSVASSVRSSTLSARSSQSARSLNSARSSARSKPGSSGGLTVKKL